MVNRFQSTERPGTAQRGFWGRLMVAAAFVLPAAIHAQGRENVGTVTQPLRGGEVITGYTGVVDIGGCTGSMIAPSVVLTAAHCFFGGPMAPTRFQGSGNFTISYYDPNRGRRPVFGGTARWMILPQYAGANVDGPGDANADLGAILIPGRFSDTDYQDYLRIYADTSESLETRLAAYGAGLYTYSGKSDEHLRTSWFEVESVERNHIVVDTRHLVSICQGDSGGPLVFRAEAGGSTVPLIAGVTSQIETDSANEGDLCSNNDPPHDDAFFCRPNLQKMKTIAELTGISCKQLENASKSYLRCFDLPFIEDVPYEGVLQRDLALAVVVSSII